MARYAPADLTPMLTEHTLEDAAAALTRLDHRYELVPSTHRSQFAATVEDLLAAARTNSFSDLNEVIAHSRWLVALAARMPEEALAKPDSLEEADRAHLYRNTLLTLVVAALAGHPGTPNDVGAKMAALGQRTPSALRAHTDDEILLLRMWVLHMSLCGDKNSCRTAAVYGEIDAGLNAGETTEIEPEHVTFESDLVVDGSSSSGWIEAPGLRGVANRDIELNTFNSHLIRNHIHAADLTKHKHLTYWPRNEYKDAERYAKGCASVITAMNTIRKHAGLHHTDTAASSITEWRIRHTRDTQGYDAALKLSGRNSTCLNGRLKDRNPSPEPDETQAAKSQKNQMLDI
ncbi:hypothetical protein [Nocardioides sp. P5_E3]